MKNNISISKSVFLFAALTFGAANSSYALEIRETLRTAGAFVEPSVTYETSNSRISTPIGGSSGELAGYGVGLRAGGHISETLFLGVDGRYSFPSIQDNRTGLDGDAEAWNWGPTVGVQMPNIGLRLWAGYIVDSEIDPERGSIADIKFDGGEGYRIGAGFKLYNFSVNLEYQNIDYGAGVLQRGTSFVPSTTVNSINYENESYLASLSFPFAL